MKRTLLEKKLQYVIDVIYDRLIIESFFALTVSAECLWRQKQLNSTFWLISIRSGSIWFISFKFLNAYLLPKSSSLISWAINRNWKLARIIMKSPVSWLLLMRTFWKRISGGEIPKWKRRERKIANSKEINLENKVSKSWQNCTLQ